MCIGCPISKNIIPKSFLTRCDNDPTITPQLSNLPQMHPSAFDKKPEAVQEDPFKGFP